MKFPVFSLKNREFGFFRDGFAPDCLLQRRVGSELGSDAPGIMESGAAVGIDTHRTNSSLGSVAGALWWGDPAPPQRRGYSRGAAPSSDFLDQLHLRAVGRGNPAHMPTVVDALFEAGNPALTPASNRVKLCARHERPRHTRISSAGTPKPLLRARSSGLSCPVREI